MIISFGEILIDNFINIKTNKKSKLIGGAPFNVYYQIKRMGSNALFIGNIGNDDDGKYIKKFFIDNNLDTSGLHLDKNRKTTSSSVTLKGSERSFVFNRDNTADPYFLDSSLDFISKGDIIHLGSLMLSIKEGRDFFDKVIEYSKSQNKILSFDVNYREDIYKDKDEAKRIYQRVIPQFDIVKLSSDELYLLTDKNDIDSALSKLNKSVKLYLITLGKDGSLAYYKGKKEKVASLKFDSIDTTGAGDAYMGSILSSIDSIGLNEMLFIPSLLKSSMKFANIAGGLTTTKYGAINGIPTYKEVNSVLEKNTKI